VLWRCVAVCRGLLQCVAHTRISHISGPGTLSAMYQVQCVAVCCSVLQQFVAAVCGIVLQFVADTRIIDMFDVGILPAMY